MHIDYSIIRQCYKLSKMINHHVVRRAKQHVIIHMKRTFRIISCSVVCSNIYRKVRSCFRFRRSTRRFNNKLFHGELCLALNERNYILQATIAIELFFALILTSKISRDQITSSENILTITIFIVNGPLTQMIVYSLPMSNHFLLRTNTRFPTCKTTHRTAVCSMEHSQTILIISNVFSEVNHLETTLKLS